MNATQLRRSSGRLLEKIKRELMAFPLCIGSGSLVVLCYAERQNLLVAMASQLEQPRYMSECEVRLAREWYSKSVPVDHIAERLDRSKTSVWDKIGAEARTKHGESGARYPSAKQTKISWSPSRRSWSRKRMYVTQ